MAPNNRYDEILVRSIRRIVDDLDSPPRLDDLAHEAGFSAYYFHRLFRGRVGETPTALTRRLRLERAAQELQGTDTSLIRLAVEAGYASHEAFTRAFQSAFGVSPSAFRRGVERRPFLASANGAHYRPDGAHLTTLRFLKGAHPMSVHITTHPTRRLACVSHVGPYDQIGTAFGTLGAAAARSGLFAAGGRMVGIYHDDPETTPASELRSEAALEVGEDAVLPDGLDERRIPAGRYAEHLHTGPYTELGEVWARLLGEWLPESGAVVRDDLCLERYLNSPTEVAPEQLQTLLLVPVV